jgi:hypothetical protein
MLRSFTRHPHVLGSLLRWAHVVLPRAGQAVKLYILGRYWASGARSLRLEHVSAKQDKPSKACQIKFVIIRRRLASDARAISSTGCRWLPVAGGLFKLLSELAHHTCRNLPLHVAVSLCHITHKHPYIASPLDRPTFECKEGDMVQWYHILEIYCRRPLIDLPMFVG